MFSNEVDEKKKISLAGMSQNFIKNGFDKPENLFPLTGMQNSFKASSGRVA